MNPLTIKLHPNDNVAVALTELSPGSAIGAGGITCESSIPAGHKVATRNIGKNEPVLKYGHIIGAAVSDIGAGHHVHTHNMVMWNFTRDYAFCRDTMPIEIPDASDQATFKGIIRPDGGVATRNYIGVLATVNCSASIARFISDSFTGEVLGDFPNVDGVVSLTHGTGCSMVPEGEGFIFLQRTLSGYAKNPNFAGVVLVGLGCEVNHVDCLMKNMELEEGLTVRPVTIQEAGGTEESVRRGIEAVREMLPGANRVKREDVSCGNIVLGLECGGSDGYSGISANPAVGAAVDILVRYGGTAILSETPEIYGAEHLLTRRAVNREVGEKLISRIKWWEEYTSRLGAVINNNPTPGNKDGGLTTILEKSLGALAKGGTTNLVEVYGYGETVSKKGLVFMDTPGYDAASVTGMIAGGANMICFTTGRGSVSGFKPVPTVKLASNTDLFNRLRNDMDVNCGLVVDGDLTVLEMGESIFRLLLEVASGRKTRSEVLGFGDSEFVPWNIGPVM